MKLIEIASKDGILLQECLSNCFCSSDKVFWDCIAKINLKKCLKSDCFVKALFVDASFGQRIKTMLNRKNLPALVQTFLINHIFDLHRQYIHQMN